MKAKFWWNVACTGGTYSDVWMLQMKDEAFIVPLLLLHIIIIISLLGAAWYDPNTLPLTWEYHTVFLIKKSLKPVTKTLPMQWFLFVGYPLEY